MNRVALGLLSTIRIMGTLPIIRAPPGGAAEMLASEVTTILRENISSRGPAQPLFEDCLVHSDRSQRPLMIIMDRSNDLFPMLQHNSTYQALIAELLDFKLNRVTVEIPEKAAAGTTATPTGPGKKKTYDLNTHNDHFLSKYSSAPFPEAVDANEKELAEISQREAAIRSRPDFAKLSASLAGEGMGETNDNNMMSSLENKGKDLSDAIESLPEILLKKSILETHTNIMQSLMKKIATREIPTYFESEQTLLTLTNKSAIDRPTIVALLKDGTKGNAMDKCRLMGIVAAMSDPAATTKAMNEEYDQAFTQGCQAMTTGQPSQEEITKLLSVIQFLRRLISLQSGTSSMMSKAFFGAQSSQSSGNALISSFFNSASSSASSLIAKATSFFTKFIPYHITRVVSVLSEGGKAGGNEDETYVYFDPKQQTNNNSGFTPGQKYSDVIVFVIGGGCYSEYYNLQGLLKEKATSNTGYPRHIVYGCTDLLSGDEFIKQVENMLQQSSSNNNNNNSTSLSGK
jgi:Tfp pilus assembly protein FimT